MVQTVRTGSNMRGRSGSLGDAAFTGRGRARSPRQNDDIRAVPIFREVMADLETPVSAYLKIRGAGPAFLLESIEGGERLARYSFIGSDPIAVLTMRDGLATLETAAAGMRRLRTTTIRSCLSRT